MSLKCECRARARARSPSVSHVLLFFGFLSTLLSIRDFMLRAAQTKWISRLVAKTSIQEALLQYEQELRDAALSFQVRRLTVLLVFFGRCGARGLSLREIGFLFDRDTLCYRCHEWCFLECQRPKDHQQ